MHCFFPPDHDIRNPKEDSVKNITETNLMKELPNYELCSQPRKFRSSLVEVFCKKMFFKTLKNTQKNTCVGVSFNNVASAGPAALLKRDPGTSVFL